MTARTLVCAARALLRDRRGTEAVELAIVIFPFLYVLLVIIQMGLYYMTQSALDAAVNNTASYYRNSWNTGAVGAATMPSGSALKAQLISNGTGLINENASLVVDLRLLTTLDGGAVPIADQTVDAGIAGIVPIVLRARTKVVTLAPGFGSLTQVQSAAILRSGSF
jgi:hypothetical protein